MRILVVLPWVPSRQRPRAARLIDLLAEEHEVHYVAAAWSDDEFNEEVSSRANSGRIIRLSRCGAYRRVALALFRSRSLQQAYVEDRRLVNLVLDATASLAPDVVVFNVIRSAGLARYLPRDTGIVVDLDELRSRYYTRLGRSSSSWLYRIIGRLEAPRMQKAERVALDRSLVTLVSSSSDLVAGANVRLVRTPITVPFVRRRTADSAPRVTIVGRMSYRANQEAVSWFLREVWPEVRSRNPGSVFRVVGDSPPRWMSRLRDPSVIVTGRVPSVEEALLESTLAVVPVTLATGVQMKLLEAIAVGTPVVTTPLVAHLAGLGNDACAIASTPSEWIDAIDGILRDPSQAAARAARAQSWLTDHHSPRAVAGQLQDALSGVTSSAESAGGIER